MFPQAASTAKNAVRPHCRLSNAERAGVSLLRALVHDTVGPVETHDPPVQDRKQQRRNGKADGTHNPAAAGRAKTDDRPTSDTSRAADRIVGTAAVACSAKR